MFPAASLESRSYEDVDPRSQWLSAEDSDTLLVDVTGFKKENMRVMVNTSGSLKISGEYPIEGNRWARFHKEFRVPKNCDPKGIMAKFDRDSGLLYVILPKKDIARKAVPAMEDTGAKSSGGGEAEKEAKEEAEEEHSSPKTYRDEGDVQQQRLPPIGRPALGLSKGKMCIVKVVVVVVAVGVSLGLGAYALYKFKFAAGEGQD